LCTIGPVTPGGETDYLIVGQGLAGTVLAWQLRARGARVFIVDGEEAGTASRVAAGIMTPITGKRLAKSWRIDELWPAARDFYRERERELGADFFHERPVVRVFASEEEAELWAKRWREEREQYADYVAEESGAVFSDGAIVAPFGGIAMRCCGYLDVAGFIDASREFFRELGCYRCGVFDEEVFDANAAELEWDGIRILKGVVHCAGYGASRSRFFDWIPFKAAKGEILEVEIGGLEEERILNRGNWLLPQGDGKFRTGTTYEWERLDSEPSEEGRRAIEAKLRGLVAAKYRVTGHVAAVRPIINESKVLMGRHPAHERLAFYNGLGSKGVLGAPFFAEQLAGHLEEGTRIEERLNLRKNF
jgi:glycine/D-amino acid oxidase-like deaminating enzyme